MQRQHVATHDSVWFDYKHVKAANAATAASQPPVAAFAALISILFSTRYRVWLHAVAAFAAGARGKIAIK